MMSQNDKRRRSRSPSDPPPRKVARSMGQALRNLSDEDIRELSQGFVKTAIAGMHFESAQQGLKRAKDECDAARSADRFPPRREQLLKRRSIAEKEANNAQTAFKSLEEALFETLNRAFRVSGDRSNLPVRLTDEVPFEEYYKLLSVVVEKEKIATESKALVEQTTRENDQLKDRLDKIESLIESQQVEIERLTENSNSNQYDTQFKRLEDMIIQHTANITQHTAQLRQHATKIPKMEDQITALDKDLNRCEQTLEGEKINIRTLSNDAEGTVKQLQRLEVEFEKEKALNQKLNVESKAFKFEVRERMKQPAPSHSDFEALRSQVQSKLDQPVPSHADFTAFKSEVQSKMNQSMPQMAELDAYKKTLEREVKMLRLYMEKELVPKVEKSYERFTKEVEGLWEQFNTYRKSDNDTGALQELLETLQERMNLYESDLNAVVDAKSDELGGILDQQAKDEETLIALQNDINSMNEKMKDLRKPIDSMGEDIKDLKKTVSLYSSTQATTSSAMMTAASGSPTHHFRGNHAHQIGGNHLHHAGTNGAHRAGGNGIMTEIPPIVGQRLDVLSHATQDLERRFNYIQTDELFRRIVHQVTPQLKTIADASCNRFVEFTKKVHERIFAKISDELKGVNLRIDEVKVEAMGFVQVHNADIESLVRMTTQLRGTIESFPIVKTRVDKIEEDLAVWKAMSNEYLAQIKVINSKLEVMSTDDMKNDFSNLVTRFETWREKLVELSRDSSHRDFVVGQTQAEIDGICNFLKMDPPDWNGQEG